MIIYIDENLPQVFAQGFNLLQQGAGTGIEVKSIIDDFGRGASDEDWMAGLDRSRSCVITKDLNINKRPHQRRLCQSYHMGIFFIKGPRGKGLTYWQTLRLLVSHWEEIINYSTHTPMPFGFEIGHVAKNVKQIF